MPAAPASSPVLALEHVHKRFGTVVAVHDATLEVARGEFFSLLGPSGCGKTTLLRLVAGFDEPTSGRILLDGSDTRGVPPFRRAVNTVFQQYALFPHLDVFDNVAFGPRAQRVPEAEVRRRVAAMLEVVRLADLGRRRPDQLSGGQRQRVALARALVNRPSALLLDEPLSALDRSLREAMRLELQRVQREVGVAFVFVTHDQEEALALSDRLAVLRDGRIEQVGTPEEVYLAPANAFVAAFLGAANLLPVIVLGVRGGTADIELPGGLRVAAPCDTGVFATGDRAVVMVRPERVRVAGAAPEGDLEVAMPVTLREVTFQGAVLRCVLLGPAGDEIVASIDERARPAGLVPGSAVWAAWSPASARLLPARDDIG